LRTIASSKDLLGLTEWQNKQEKLFNRYLVLSQNLLDFSTIAAGYSAHVTPPRVTSQTQVENSPMRLVRALKFLFLLLLAVLLFGGEVGESACLVDDISNDYILAPASPVLQLVQRAPAHLIFQGSFKVADELTLKLAVIPSGEASRSSASDLLRLLSIQRK
jgi:hypothetical protein